MGLLQKLKSALGLNGSEPSSRRSAGDVDVTVEREPSTDDEDAVKGTDTATSDAETESAVSEPEPDSESDLDSDDEPVVEEAEPETEAETESESEPESETEADDEPPASEGSEDPVTEINGIGPAYGERLSKLDIETVGELAVADADEIEAETDLSAKRVADWIEQAREY